MDIIEEIELQKHVCMLALDKAEKILSTAILASTPPFVVRRFEAEVAVYKIALKEINKQLAEASAET